MSTRRDFIKAGLAGLAGASFSPLSNARADHNFVQTGDKNPLLYRILGRTQLKVPVISIGCGHIRDAALLRACFDAGLNYFDTAPGYGGGHSESLLGDMLAGKPRQSFIVSSKVSLPGDSRTGLLPAHYSKQEIVDYVSNQIEGTLQRLKVDRLDIFFLYGAAVPDLFDDARIRAAFTAVQKSGKTSFLGVSFHQNEATMIRKSLEAGFFDVILTAFNFRQPHREEVRQAIAEVAAAGLGVVAMKAMAGVYWDRERSQPINSQAAIKWLMQEEHVHAILPGIKSIHELQSNLALMRDPQLTPGEMSDLKLSSGDRCPGLYCAQCRHCVDQCRFHLDIPAAMRSYMYAYGYGNTAQAKHTLVQAGIEKISCHRCTQCSVSCQMGFKVAEKMQNIDRLVHVPDEFLA